MHIASLYRYPVKGLTPASLRRATLTPGAGLPWDRAFALAQGDGAFDPADPAWVAKSNFMCLLRNAKIATIQSLFDETARQLTLRAVDGAQITADPLTPDGQAGLTAFLIAQLGAEARFGAHGHPPAFVYVNGHSFCDHQTQVVSLIGLASLRALEAAAGAARDQRRFRANIYISEGEPWAEFAWLGKTLQIGTARLLVRERIDRCGATSVNPDTALRDANPVRELQRHFGHIDLGIFADVIAPGTIAPGDEIRVL